MQERDPEYPSFLTEAGLKEAYGSEDEASSATGDAESVPQTGSQVQSEEKSVQLSLEETMALDLQHFSSAAPVPGETPELGGAGAIEDALPLYPHSVTAAGNTLPCSLCDGLYKCKSCHRHRLYCLQHRCCRLLRGRRRQDEGAPVPLTRTLVFFVGNARV